MSQKSSSPVNAIGGIVLTLVAALVIWYVATQLRFDPSLDRSAIGFDGLVQLLDEQDRSARSFVGGTQLDTEQIGVRVLPLFGELDSSLFFTARTPEETYLLAPQHFMASGVLERKVDAAPTLIVFPKWSDGVRLSGLAHPEFLLENQGDSGDVPSIVESSSLAQLESERVDSDAAVEEPTEAQDTKTPSTSDEIIYRDDLDDEAYQVEPLVLPDITLASADTTGLERVSAGGFGTLSLRAPQYMRTPKDCAPLIGTRDQALLVECTRRYTDVVYWMLSDPDVLNNHGLHLGRNVDAALNIIDRLSGGGEVVLDYSTQLWSMPTEDRRTIAELMRFFAPPFAWIWLAALLLFALALWRGSVRDRPIQSTFGHGHSGTRYTIVAAQSRLMRNTGRDGALLRALAYQRVQSLCDLLLGRDERATDRKARMLAFLERRSPDLAQRMVQVLEDTETAPERLPPGNAVALLTRLETVYEEARQLA